MVMETYHRKHPKKANQSAGACQKEAVVGSIAAASGTPSSGRLHHVPPPALSDHQRTILLKEPQVEVGYLYEIDHRNLPPRTPVHLRSIRVALVCEKTEVNIAVRFPSKESLRAFFGYSTRETHPNLDEKFVMGIACAQKVLVKLVPLESFSEQKKMETFWLVESKSSDHMFKDDNNVTVVDRKGSADSFCSEALKLNGIVRWGIRRQVKYMGRHKEMENDGTVKYDVKGIEGSHMNLQAACDDTEENNISGGDEEGEEDEEVDGDEEGEEDEEDEDEEDEEEEGDEEEEDEEEGDTKIKRGIDMNLKRKRYPFRNIGAKKIKRENLEIKKKKTAKKSSQIKKSSRGKGKAKASIFRNALVLRDPKDRWSTERYKMAEKNLLSVMKSKKATAETPILRPQLRAEARKKIGDTGLLDHLLKHMAGRVAPGSNERFRRRHNPDGAMEYWLESADLVGIRKEAGVSDPYWVPPPGWKLGDSPTQDPICARELKILKDGMKKMERDFNETKGKLEAEVGRLRREVSDLSAFKKRTEEENKQPLTTAASNHCIMDQRLGQLATSLDSSKFDLGSALVLPVEKCKEQLMGIHDFVKVIEEKVVKALMAAGSSPEKSPELPCKSILTTSAITPSKDQQLTAAKEKEKAAKIERMKSGFRICKPEGTFRWPNMVKDNHSVMSTGSNSNQAMIQVEASTPPSVHSSTAPALAPPQPPHHQLLAMNPLAKKRAVKVTVSTDYNSNSAAGLINFNTVPSPKLNHIPLEYEKNNCYPCEVGNWLALSTLTSASPDSAHG